MPIALALYGVDGGTGPQPDPENGTVMLQFTTDNSFRCGTIQELIWHTAAGNPGYEYQFSRTVHGQKVRFAVDVSRTGPKIDPNLFGQFAEHLGHGIYEGLWVGPDSRIPNTRGIRNDVVAALKVLMVPNVRWPGGCFADECHWQKGSGPQRTVTLNPNWGGVTEPNTFGTHEFMDFLGQIGSEAYLSVNVGSGTPREAAEWLEYRTAAQPTTLTKRTCCKRLSGSMENRLWASATKDGRAAAT